MLAERTFRVFISSTFEDFKAEREALHKKVFPSLKRYCLKRGASFQPIDLRWGISEEASLDQRTMSICLAELERCQRVSPRPNFVLMLGDRYGWRPLPEQIPASEFSALLSCLSGTGEAELLLKWYKLDENAAPDDGEPGAYVLLPRTGAERDHAVWSSTIEKPLAAALRHAAAEIGLSGDALLRYQASATHREIIEGALTVPDAESHVFAYLRCFDRPPEAVAMTGFRDLVDGRRDADAETMLDTLKSQIRTRLPADHVLDYNIAWEARDDTAARGGLVERVERDLKGIIDEELEALSPISREQWEDRAHCHFADDRRLHFVGRESPCARLLDYLAGKEDRPLVVHGDAGMGKTALLAEVVSRIPPERLCPRFVGATPETGDLRGLLESVACHLADGQTVPTSLADLRPWLAQFLGRDSKAGVSLVIDGIDELTGPEAETTLFDWLPRRLGNGVRVVVSITGTVERPTLWLKAARAAYGDSALFPLDPLSGDEAEGLLDHILKSRGRRISPRQSKQMMRAIGRGGSPLRLRLLAEEACRWRSFDTTPDDLPRDVPAAIGVMLETLALPENHGRLLVAKSLGYLLASRHGLAEDELLEVLTLDTEFFKAFEERSWRLHQALPAGSRQIPFIVWARLHADLAPYLSESRSGGSRLIGFRDRQVALASMQLFTTPESQRAAHEVLARLFGDPDPRELNTSRLRRLTERPFQLAEAGQWEELTETLISLDFVASKAEAGLSYDLLADFDRLLAERPNHAAVAQLRQLIWREAPGLRRSPSLAQQQVRLGLARFSSLAPELVEQCRSIDALGPPRVEPALPEFAAEQLALPVDLAADAIVATPAGVLVWQKGGRWVEIGPDGMQLAGGHGPGAPVTLLAMSGRAFAAASANVVLLWPHWPAGAPQAARCPSPVQKLAWSGDGTRLLAVGQNGDWQTFRRPDAPGAWPTERSGSEAGRVIAAWLEEDGRPAFILADGQVRQVQKDGYRVTRLEGGEWACAVRSSRLNAIFVAGEDELIRMFAGCGELVWSALLEAPVRRLSLSDEADGPLLLAALANGSLWIGQAAAGTETRSFAVSKHALTDVAPFSDGSWAVTRDYVGDIALVPLGRRSSILAPNPLPARGRIRALRWDFKAHGAAGVDEHGARFAVAPGQSGWRAQSFKDVPSPADRCIFLPDGRLVSVEAALSANNVYLHEPEGGRSQKVWPRTLAFEEFRTLAAIGLSPDGHHGAMVIRRPVIGGVKVGLFVTDPWRELDHFEVPDREIVRVAVSNGLERVLFGFNKVIEPPALWTRRGMINLPMDGGVKAPGFEQGEAHALYDMAICADGSRYLAIDQHGALWQFDHPLDGRPVSRQIGAGIFALDLSPDGQTAAVLHGDRLLEVFNLRAADDPRRLCRLIAPWNVEFFRLVPGLPVLLLGGRGAICAYSYPREVSPS
jgi:hypothetical protein